MNWKNRLTNYNFWISIVSAVLLILQAFKFEFDIVNINEIATAVLGLLVVIGIISDPTKSSSKQSNTAIKESEQIPSVKENETDGVFNKDDFKVLIDTISADLKSKLSLDEKNTETVEIEEEKSEETQENEINDEKTEINEFVQDVKDEVIEITSQKEIEVEVATLVENNAVLEKVIKDDNTIETENKIEAIEENFQEDINKLEIEHIEENKTLEEEKIQCYNIVNN